jgi:hypothetical protein
MRDDHVEFERKFADIRERARSGDWRELDAVWSDFAAAVTAHLAFEERDILPSLRFAGADERALVRRLEEEHAAIRQLLQDLGVQIQLHTIRAGTVDVFLQIMRDHAALENERIYPWLEARERAMATARPGRNPMR